MANDLSLFSDAEVMDVASGAACSSASVCPVDFNPCTHCRYHGLCDSDECAMKCYHLDMNHAPTARG